MLTRLRIKRDFRLFARCLSDKPADGDGKAPKSKYQLQKKIDSPKDESAKSDFESSSDKIQALLKTMLAAKPVISEEEYMNKFTVAPERKRKQESDEIEVKIEQIEVSITKAAGEVAQAIGGDVKQTEAELLSKVLGKINQTSTSLSDLLVGMTVDRSTEGDFSNETRGQQVKRLVDKNRVEAQRNTRFSQRRASQQPQRDESRVSSKFHQSIPQAAITVNIFGGQPLGIFTKKEPNYGTKLEVWESLKARELSLATAQPPSNYFQKMIQWTEQGKVWKFPIDNEQGLEEEQNIHFSEHVFLDQHLDDWCPKRGPIRHFMELVCTGLSKNAFYTVKEKRDHISWYREYFESKKDVLTEVGAWNMAEKTSEATA